MSLTNDTEADDEIADVDEDERLSLRAGHPLTWDPIIAGTVLQGTPFPHSPK